MADRIGTDGVNDVLVGTILSDFMDGKGGDDTLTAKGSDDVIIGGLGNDKMSGGGGDDVFRVGDNDAKISEFYDGGDGKDTLEITSNIGSQDGLVSAKFDISAIFSIEVLKFSGAGGHDAFLSASHFGGGGFSSALQLVGANSSDRLVVDCNTESTIDMSGWSLSNWTGQVFVRGTFEDELVKGSAAAEEFDMDVGFDRVFAGGGNDTIILDVLQNTEIYDGGAGTDRLRFTAANTSLTLGTFASIEEFEFKFPGFIAEQTVRIRANDVGGGTFASNLKVISNGSGGKVLQIDMAGEINFSASAFQFENPVDGDPISLRFNGGAAAEVISGSVVGDTMLGNGDNDLLAGGAGNDVLDGGTGDDIMLGGAGDDEYTVDAAGDIAAEIVVGSDPGGKDSVRSSVTHTLTGFIENLTLTGVEAIGGTGNSLKNAITGNDGANELRGLGGGDTLRGGLGADWLLGGVGNDRFVYGAVADSALGAANRDVIRDFAVAADKIDLRPLDARSDLDGVQDLTLDAGGGLAAGEVRIRESNGNTLIEANTDGVAGVDFQILVRNALGLTGADLLL